jgi:hypothetical protein
MLWYSSEIFVSILYIKATVVSVYLSVQAVPEKFFQSLPVPYGVICKRGGGGGGGGGNVLNFFLFEFVKI